MCLSFIQTFPWSPSEERVATMHQEIFGDLLWSSTSYHLHHLLHLIILTLYPFSLPNPAASLFLKHAKPASSHFHWLGSLLDFCSFAVSPDPYCLVPPFTSYLCSNSALSLASSLTTYIKIVIPSLSDTPNLSFPDLFFIAFITPVHIIHYHCICLFCFQPEVNLPGTEDFVLFITKTLLLIRSWHKGCLHVTFVKEHTHTHPRIHSLKKYPA